MPTCEIPYQHGIKTANLHQEINGHILYDYDANNISIFSIVP